jgi:hypothetical protein
VWQRLKRRPACPGAQAASAVAEFFADIALCPLEAARIRLVAQPGYAPGVGGALTRLAAEEGVARGLYAGFGPMLFKQVGGAQALNLAPLVVFLRACSDGAAAPCPAHRAPRSLTSEPWRHHKLPPACGQLAAPIAASAAGPR